MIKDTLNRYIWLVDTLARAGEKGLTLQEISEKWEDNYEFSNGEGYPRRTFNNHRADLESVFGIIIDCNKSTNCYYISNRDELNNAKGFKKWLLDGISLRNVLNDYDLETHDFYEWTEELSREEVHERITSHLKMDLGPILGFEIVEKGPGGHISKLRIVGKDKAFIIGKELEIRRILSTSHLKSSAFTVEAKNVRDGVPCRFVLHGHGWGHGVGLCQIGAAVMGERGFSYKQILKHYYTDVQIKRLS